MDYFSDLEFVCFGSSKHANGRTKDRSFDYYGLQYIKGGEIYVFDMGEPVRIADLAQRMINLSGAKDVKIVYSGLRDGEKLYEELLNDMEKTKPTHHSKIKIASVQEYDYQVAKLNEEELYQLSFSYDAMAIVKKMKQIVPEFKSQQSRYQVLDN